jgi:Xaa-Pro aminopeptidase
MAEMEGAGRKAGAELAACWLVTGQPADRPRYRFEENEREVHRGDNILCGTYVTYRGYWAHCLRMGSLGPPSETYQRIYDATLEQHRQAAARIQVGGNAADVQFLADELADTLLPGGGNHSMRSRHGHFMGLDYAEKPTGAAFPQPSFWSQFPVPPPAGVKFRAGMVLETHTMLGKDGEGFGFLGDVYLATDDGPQRLTQFPQDLFIA